MNKILAFSSLIILIILCISCQGGKSNDIFEGQSDYTIIERGEKVLNNNYTKLYENSLENDPHIAYPVEIAIVGKVMYILDAGLPGIVMYSLDGEFIGEYGQKGKAPGEFINPNDIHICNGHIYCLDDRKQVISKFDMNFELLWERRIPSKIMKGLSPKSISIVDDSIFLSGFIYFNHTPILWKLNEDMNIIDSYLVFNHTFGGKNKLFKYALSTGNKSLVDSTSVYLAMFSGKNIIYSYDLETKKIQYCVMKPAAPSNDFSLLDHRDGGQEAMTFLTSLEIKATENYIITMEECGGESKEDAQPPKDYYNNLSFYKKDDTYLFSFQDKSIPYSYDGYGFDVVEVEDGFDIYIISRTRNSLMKYNMAYRYQS